MLNVIELENGDLAVSIYPDCLDDIGENDSIYELMESYSCNGSYTPFDASDGNPFVGLTSAPCIAESMSVDDDGNQTIDGNFWYFSDYMVTDEMEKLRHGETVIYTLAR